MSATNEKEGAIIDKILAPADVIEVTNGDNRFNIIYQKNLNARWHITVITMIILLFIIVGILASILLGVHIASEWKEIFLLMLGVFSGSYNRIVDYWFNNGQTDNQLIEKVDDENDTLTTLKTKMLKRQIELTTPKAQEQEKKKV